MQSSKCNMSNNLWTSCSVLVFVLSRLWMNVQGGRTRGPKDKERWTIMITIGVNKKIALVWRLSSTIFYTLSRTMLELRMKFTRVCVCVCEGEVKFCLHGIGIKLITRGPRSPIRILDLYRFKGICACACLTLLQGFKGLVHGFFRMRWFWNSHH